MYTPWFSSTDETAQLILKTGQQDYLDFIELTNNASSKPESIAWHTTILLSFADLLIESGTRIKRNAASHLYTSLQTR